MARSSHGDDLERVAALGEEELIELQRDALARARRRRNRRQTQASVRPRYFHYLFGNICAPLLRQPYSHATRLTIFPGSVSSHRVCANYFKQRTFTGRSIRVHNRIEHPQL
jgi:hypothetical protein